MNKEDDMYSRSGLAIGASLIVSSVLVGAQTPAPSASPSPSQAPPATVADSAGASSDRTFVVNAAMAGMAEVEHGRLATGKAVNAKVKDFGEHMIADHTLAGNELKSLAATKAITLPLSLDPAHQAAHDRYATLPGGEFDRAYMQDMVADHQKAVADFTAEANSGKDPEVKAWARKALPTLQTHLKMAQDLQKELGASAGSVK
jgi:putative membrane protein